MSGSGHEKEFDAYLSRRAGLHGGLTGHEDLEPPDELDRIVLAQAREAIRIPKMPLFFTATRWALPLALAATVVLAFSVLLHFGRIPLPGREAPPPIAAHSEDRAAPAAGMSEADVHVDPMTVPLPEMQAPLSASASDESGAAKPDSSKGVSHRRLRAEEATVSRTAGQAAAESATTPADPAEWLRRIETLRAQGRKEEASREWQAFRQAWPHYPVTNEPSR